MGETSVGKKRSKVLGWTAGAVILVALAGAGAYAVFGMSGDQPASAVSNDALSGIPVVVTPVEKRVFEERIEVQGNVAARNTALVAARMPGTLTEVYVREGDEVKAGETLLFMSDDVKTRNAVDAARHELGVARAALGEKVANRDKVDAEYRKAAKDFERFERLYQDKAVSLDLYEQQQTRMELMEVARTHAATLLELGSQQVKQAESALAIAEKTLSDATVVAPISGRVTMRFQEPGEMGDPGKPVVRIEDPTVLEVSAFLPAETYPRVTEGETLVRLNVYGLEIDGVRVTYKSPSIHPDLRTYEIKCLLDNPPDGVAPGAMAEILVLLGTRTALGVPRDALVARGDATLVFLAEDGQAQSVTVRRGIETDGWIEVSGDGLAPGAQVVTMGQSMLEDGALVTVRGEAG
jgi:RND family efflux transporter MFP subunit